MLSRDRARIQHAVRAAEKALELAANLDLEDLEKDEVLALALVHLLEVVGEACNQVSRDFQKGHPGVPWKKAIALRHRLIHGYFDIDLGIVLATIHHRLPSLIQSLRECL